jgi:hypothetical protein
MKYKEREVVGVSENKENMSANIVILQQHHPRTQKDTLSQDRGGDQSHNKTTLTANILKQHEYSLSSEDSGIKQKKQGGTSHFD